MELTLHVKGQYFEEIKSGSKRFEYRLKTEYWTKRLSKDYDTVRICLGYPSRDNTARMLRFKWLGFDEETIEHPHFGSEPVDVFSIKLFNRIFI